MKAGKTKAKYLVNRTWEKPFVEVLTKMGFDSYGYVWEPCLSKFMSEVKCKDGSYQKFENDVFVLIPYYWGNDKKVLGLPNFLFKSTGFEISWYKYPFRSAQMNQEISLEEFVKMLEKCTESVNK